MALISERALPNRPVAENDPKEARMKHPNAVSAGRITPIIPADDQVTPPR